MITRHLAKAVKRAAREYPVVSMTGPRQSGKTTLVRSVFPGHDYVSLENPDHRAFAVEDPRGFLDQFDGSVILDEVQRVPDLFSYIQGLVDEDDRHGRFILTGSQNFLLLQRISQTLAGRCSVLHLLPLSRAELMNRPIIDVARIGRTRGKKTLRDSGSHSTDDLFDMMWKGSYPRIWDKKLRPQAWLSSYYQTYIERDVRDVLHVGDTEMFGRFVRLCAGRCGQLLNLSSLASDCGVSHSTARRWLSILESSFLVVLLRPHHRNFNKRMVKSPKLYFLDTGLLCYLLRIRSAQDLLVHANRGAIFEAWVISELIKSYHHLGLDSDIYFWRDSAGHEIDLMIDHGDQLVPIEIKSGQTIGSDFFKGLDYWRSLAEKESSPAILVYGGDSSSHRRGVAVTSWMDWC